MSAQQYLTPQYLDAFIAFLIQEFKPPKNVTSKPKSPCTYCNTTDSPTWRPGPCGAGTLCNTCGVKYMDSGKRKRQIDLVLKRNIPVWVKKDPTSWMWKEDKEAPKFDSRVINWVNREKMRLTLTTQMNPPAAKKMRL